MKKPKVSIFLLTRNRPNFAYTAAVSFLKQSYKNFYFVISDNSDSFSREISELIYEHFPQGKYIKRKRVLTAKEHYIKVISEVKTKYFILFHDDDIAFELFVEDLLNFIESNDAFSAVGCNAFLIKNRNLTKIKLFESSQSIIKICEKKVLANKYFSFFSSGIAPFPGYIYRKKYIRTMQAKIPFFGKYFDYLTLEALLEDGCLGWINTPLMGYRRHKKNDSNDEDIASRLSILAHLKKNCPSEVETFRFYFYAKLYPLANSRLFWQIFKKYPKPVWIFLISKFLKIIFTREFYRKIANFSKNKLLND